MSVMSSSATINLTASKHKLEVVEEKEETSFDFDFQKSLKKIWRGIFFATMRFLRKPQLCVKALLDFASWIWNRTCYLFNWYIRSLEPVKYECAPISPLSSHRLGIVPKKTLVLDLDETLVHSCHGSVTRNKVRPGTPYDFVIQVVVEKQLVTFHVYKRPYVDYFLEIVSQWYNVVLFTASLEVYGDAVADRLDDGRNILRRRYYRQHCTPDFGSYTKDISSICNDLSKICIVDNCPGAYRCFPNNAIPIQSYHSDPLDKALLRLLPLLDALRFTKDVRSVLSRNLHLNRSW